MLLVYCIIKFHKNVAAKELTTYPLLKSLLLFFFFVLRIFFSMGNTLNKLISKDVGELISKLRNTLNELIIRNELSVETIELLIELFETLKIIENCTCCKDKKIDGNDL